MQRIRNRELTRGYGAGYSHDHLTLQLSQQSDRDLNSEAGHCQKIHLPWVVLISFLEGNTCTVGLFPSTLNYPSITNSRSSCDKQSAKNCPQSAVKMCFIDRLLNKLIAPSVILLNLAEYSLSLAHSTHSLIGEV